MTLGIKPYKTKTEITFKFVSPSTLPSFLNACFCGVWNPNDNRYFPLIVTYDSRIARALSRTNSFIEYKSNIDENIHTIIYNDENHNCLFDGVIKGSVSDLTIQVDKNIYLFANNGNEGLTQISDCIIYGCKITDKDTNTLLRDFIPVLDQNNVPCLFDKVSGNFFYNQGTGTFLYG